MNKMSDKFMWFGAEDRKEYLLHKVDDNCKIVENGKAYATIDFNGNGKYGSWCVFLAHKVRKLVMNSAIIRPNWEFPITVDSVKTGKTLNDAMEYGKSEVVESERLMLITKFLNTKNWRAV